jgi:5-(carboxyamino)imidazole ribonucleotide synthase
MTPTVGIIGGGQLARMTHQAAIDLGIDLVVLCPDRDAPALQAGARHLRGAPDQLDDLLRLAASCDVVTLDHEQTPPHLLDAVARRGHRVAPGAHAASLGRDKALARAQLEPHGVPTAPWAIVSTSGEVAGFAERHGWPLYLKRPNGGYDGRGVWRAPDRTTADAALDAAGSGLLVEPVIRFDHELSVIVARSGRGETVAYPPVETVQRDGRCHEVFTPATVGDQQLRDARSLAVTIANAIDLVGTMAVELFATTGGLLLNELAVRTHNSGHLTIEACATSQFENHLRAILDLPLGATHLTVPAAAMVNLVGGPEGSDPLARLGPALAVPGARVHNYRKTARPGRKVGHITATAPTVAGARSTAAAAADALVKETAA